MTIFRPILLSIAATMALTVAAGATTLAFDGEPPANGPNHFTESGFNIVTNGDLASGSSWCAPPCPDNGTQFILFTTNESMTITASGGGAFDFLAFDGAEAHFGLTSFWATHIRAIGTRADMSVVFQDFELDFVQDATGPMADFQAFTATGFTNIISLTLSGNGSLQNWSSIDNVELGPATLGAVPLPAPFALLGAGLAGLGVARRKRRG